MASGSCTCGKCIGGLLSPKTAFRLQTCAKDTAETVLDSLPDWPQGDVPVHQPEVYRFEFLPPELRVEVRRPFAVGFSGLINTVVYCLRQSQLPKPRLLAQCAAIAPGNDKSAARFYLDNGGTPEYALDAVLAKCVEDHEALGDGSFVADAAHAAALDALPPCANDDQFEVLRRALFCTSDFWPCGPYDAGDELDAGDDDGWVHYDNSNWTPQA